MVPPFVEHMTEGGTILLTVDLEACQAEQRARGSTQSPAWQAFLHRLGDAYWQIPSWKRATDDPNQGSQLIVPYSPAPSERRTVPNE